MWQMSDLTKKWKAGKLPCDDDNHEWLAYYIKQKDGFIHADSYWRGQWGTADRNSIVEVLAPVPTYEELQELKSNRDKLAYDLGVADTLNGELLRLLKEWVEAYPVVAVTCDLKNFAKIKELLDKTNEVLK